MTSNGHSSAHESAPSGATGAVLKSSDPVPEGAVPVKGLDFDKFADRDVTVAELVDHLTRVGFQASSIGQAADIINGMVCMKCPSDLLDLVNSLFTAKLARCRDWGRNNHISWLHVQSNIVRVAGNIEMACATQACLGHCDHCWWRRRGLDQVPGRDISWIFPHPRGCPQSQGHEPYW